MTSRALTTVVIATLAFSINAAAALAQGRGSDPTKVGDNARDIVEPNAKAFWWICLVIGLLAMAASRKASRAGGIACLLGLSGIAIFNPAGVGSFMQGIADKIV